MTDSSNTTNDENLENNIENAEQQNQDQDLKKNRFLKKFVEFQYKKDGTKFINNISKSNKISGDLKKDLKFYAQNIGEFSDLNLDDIKYTDILSEVTGIAAGINNKRTQLKSLFVKGYDITGNKYTQEIFPKIENLSEKELQDLLDSDLNRGEFLKSIYEGAEVPTKINLIEKLKSFNLKSKYSSLSEEGKDAVAFFFNKLDNGYQFGTTDFSELFATGIFNAEERVKFVQTFLPTVTLEEALDTGLVKEKFVEEYKAKVAQEYLEENPTLEGVDIKKLAKKLKNTDISIETSSIIQSERDVLRAVAGVTAFQKIRDEFNEYTDQMKESTEASLSKDFEGLKEKIAEQLHLSSTVIEKFKKGNIIALEEVRNTYTKDTYSNKSVSNPEKSIRFLKIIDEGENTGKIKFQIQGENEYDSSLTATHDFPYESFLKFLQNGTAKNDEFGEPESSSQVQGMKIYTSDELERAISENKIEVNKDQFVPGNKSDAERRAEAYKEKIREENPSKSEEEIDELLEEDEEYSRLSNVDELNREQLKERIDHLDHDGHEFGFEIGTTFQTPDESIYTVLGLDDGNISLVGPTGKTEELDYQSFYNTFKTKGAKRTSNAKDFEALMYKTSTDKDIEGSWKHYIFKDNAIQKKEGAEDGIEYPYLAAEKGEELLKIISIDGNKVQIQIGNIKDKKEEDKDGNKKKVGDIFSIDKSKTFEVTTGWLHTYIKNKGLIPRSFDEKKDSKAEDIKTADINFSFGSWLFSHMSVAEVIAGFKLGLDSFQEFLKEGNDHHAAKFAEGVFGKVLPQEIKDDLKSRVEQSEKKHQDEYVEKLKAVDSNVATQMIISWLKNKNAPEYKKEAGAIFMMEKYGTLYAKDLAHHQGTFLFYKALGGRVGDDLYNEIKERNEKENLNFSEEHLIYVLLVLQCKGKLKPKRRTRLHKEFKRLRATGKDEELETGRTDAADERTVQARVEGGVDELMGGTYPNAIGWLERVVEKGGTMGEMSKIPFLMAYSGVAHDFDRVKILDAIKNFNGKGYVIPITRFMSHTSDINLLNKTILKISQRLEARGGKKFEGMGKQAQEIYDNIWSRKRPFKEKLEKTEEFYDKYGQQISRCLYMLNDGGYDDDSELSKIIFFEKDDYIDENGQKQKGDNTFKEYYTYMRGVIDADAKFDNKDIMTDALRGKGISGVHLFNFAKNIEQSQGGGFKNHDLGAYAWKEILDEFEAIIARKNYDSFYGEGAKKKLLKDMLQQFLGAILELHNGNPTVLKSYTGKTSAIGSKLTSWGINVFELAQKADYLELEHGHSKEGDKMIEKYIENMLGGGDHTQSTTDNLSEVMQTVKDTTNNNLDR